MHLQRESAARCRHARDAASRGDYPLAAMYYAEAEQGGYALPAAEDETLLAIADDYSETRNVSINALNMMRCCRDYLEDYLLYPDKFWEQYELNWNRAL